jgi:hypothetical protein
MKRSTSSLLQLLILLISPAIAQDNNFTATSVEIDFSHSLREWDGFGFNYVETAQTTDYLTDPQEYGGFSLLSEQEKREIVDLIFGDDGLKVGLVKMFLDPWHQTQPGGPFDHETTTKSMREFVKLGVERTRKRGADLSVITTLYGPPPFITKQKFLRGRDLDPSMKTELCNYFVDWVKYLRANDFPVKYVSLHNEGEDWTRWPSDGKSGNIGEGHDYNMHWPPPLINEMIGSLTESLDKNGLKDVGVTNGENTNWYRFSNWGYAFELYSNERALKNLSLITSHGFFHGAIGTRWYGDHESTGIELLRQKKPGLKAWVTSTGWGKMDTYFITEIQGNIYTSKVNGLIPWAGIQRPEKWVGGDPNPGSAIKVTEDGTYEVRQGYYFYKQVTRAGQPGMSVVRAISHSSITPVIAFSSNNTKNADAFVLVHNSADWKCSTQLNIRGTNAKKFKAYRTTNGADGERYKEIGIFEVKNGSFLYEAPTGSVTTFFAVME